MNMNILVPPLARTGYFGDQEPVTRLWRATPPGMALGLPCPSSAGEGPSRQAWKSLPAPPLSSHLSLRSPSSRPGAGGPPLEQGTAALASPPPPPSPLPQARTAPRPSTTGCRHLEEQETGSRHRRRPPGAVPKPSRGLVTRGGGFGAGKKKSAAVRVRLPVTFR